MRINLRQRRGGTLVMVAFMLVAIMGVTAIALDIGRFYVINNELQTSMDAAALAGAHRMQRSTISTVAALESDVKAHVQSFDATYNRLDNGAVSADNVSVDSVRLAYWESGFTQPDYDFAANGRKPNAVTVGWYKDADVIFAGIIGQSRPRLYKRSIAWIANLSLNCVRPWGLPYTTALYKTVTGNEVAIPAPQLSQAEINTYMSNTASNTALRRVTILGANQTSTLPNDGEWKGFNFSGNVGRPSFVDGLQGCRDYEVGTDASNGNTLPGQANQYVDWSSSVVWSNNQAGNGPGSGGGGLCYQMSAADAGCYSGADATSPGVTIHVGWGDLTGVGSDMLDFRVVGKVKLLCYYMEPPNGNQAPPSCPTPEPGHPQTGYPEGTLVLEIETIASNLITPETVLGTTTSMSQRLLLVK